MNPGRPPMQSVCARDLAPSEPRLELPPNTALSGVLDMSVGVNSLLANGATFLNSRTALDTTSLRCFMTRSHVAAVPSFAITRK